KRGEKKKGAGLFRKCIFPSSVQTLTILYSWLTRTSEYLPKFRLEEEKVLSEQQLCNQGTRTRLEHLPPRVREEQKEPEAQLFQEEPKLREAEEQLVLKREAGSSTDCCQGDGTAQTAEKSVKCDVCGKVFKYLYEMKIHRRTHTGERPFCCKICSKTFMRSSGLSVHMRVHTGHKPYSCKTCGKTFTQLSSLNYHRRTHTGEGSKPVKCDVCGKAYKHNYEMKAHRRVHTGERPFCCNTCGKGFMRSSGVLVVILPFYALFLLILFVNKAFSVYF
uniref:C2H2-type domain-containing protein n=1 Tax=Fundulus heteroclitus TaxID=8078 RepID=A0A3Q2R1C3_FUNHE